MRSILVVLVVSFVWLSSAYGGKEVDGVVNLNTASAEELQLLPGVGPAKVRSIVAYRSLHPFRTVDELVRIKGIGRKMLRRLRAHLTVTGPTTAKPGAGSVTGQAAGSGSDGTKAGSPAAGSPTP
jgi:competence ComEA-like helix-hairpin-helix protein